MSFIESFQLLRESMCEAKGYGNGSVVDHLDAAETPLSELEFEMLKMKRALELISKPIDCGCSVSHSMGCKTNEALEIEIDWMKDLAKEALNGG